LKKKLQEGYKSAIFAEEDKNCVGCFMHEIQNYFVAACFLSWGIYAVGIVYIEKAGNISASSATINI
jgi:hypothetical protein